MTRKILLFILTICMLASMAVACNKSDESESSSNPTVSAAPQSSKAPSVSSPSSSSSPEVAEYVEPDVLKLVLNTDGTATNAVDSELAVESHGADKVVAYNDAIGMNAVTLNGEQDIYTMDLRDWVAELENAYSIEVYFQITAFKTGESHLPIVSTAEGGGFALEMVHGETGVLQYVVRLDGAYECITTNVELNKWYHMVGTWDGNFITLYVDGVQIGTYDSAYAFMNFPVAENLQFLTIGGDTTLHKDGTIGNPGAASQVAVCNLYSIPLTAEEVQLAYIHNALDIGED